MMNARVFQEIMDSENLEMSKAVLIMLQEAKQCQKNIKSMIVYQHLPRIAEYIERQKELKDKAIWEAIMVAHLEKKYGFRLIEDRNEVIIATYQTSDPQNEVAKEVRRHIEIMVELEKEYGICN